MKKIIFALTLLGASGLYAQQTQRLTLEDCIRMATEESVDVRGRQLQRSRAELQVQARRHAFLPTLSAGASQGFDFGRSADKTGVLQDRSSASTSFSLSGNVTLFSGFSRLHDLKAARLQLQASEAELDQARWDIRMQVTQLYFSLLHAQRVQRVAESDVARAAEQLAYSTAMVEAGKWSRDRQAEAEAQSASSGLRLVEAQNAVALAYTDLMQAIEARINYEVEPIAVEQEVAKAEQELRPYEETYSLALGLQPSVRSSDAQLHAAKEQIASARAGYMPTLSLNAGYSNSYYYLMGNDYRGLNQPFRDQWRQNGRSHLGLSLNIPIFDAFRTRTAIRSAKHEAINLQLQRIALEKRLRKNVEQATLNAELSLRKISASRASYEANEAARLLAYERWQAGKATANDLAEANNRSFAAELDYAHAQYEFALRTRLLKLYREGQ